MINTGGSYWHNAALWKWITLAVVGFFGVIVLYAVAMGINEVARIGTVPKALIAFASCALILLNHRWLAGIFEESTAKELEMKRFLPDMGIGFGMGVGVFVLTVAIMMVFGVYRIQSVQFNWRGLLDAFSFLAIVAVCEELACRGVAQRMIENRWGSTAALLFASLGFGFMHFANDNSGIWPCIAIAVMAVEGASYYYSGKLWMPIGVHWGWNFAQGNIFGLAVSGTDSGRSIITPKIDGPYILTGGGFGAEASIITVVIAASLTVWLIYKGTKNGRYVPGRRKIKQLNMQKTYEFIKSCGTYFLATAKGDQPKVRPFGTINIFDGRLYIQTGHKKDVAKQIKANPKVELCCFKDGEWLRLSGTLVEDERIEAKKAMLDAYPELRSMYDENDGNTAVYWFKDATARFCSFTRPEEEVKF